MIGGKITKYYDDQGHIGELEEYTVRGVQKAVARLMTPGTSTWDGSIYGIRRSSMRIPPDTLYDSVDGTSEYCQYWLAIKGFKEPQPIRNT